MSRLRIAHRRTRLPEWYAPLTVEAAPSLVRPWIGVEQMALIRARHGPAHERIEIALATSGQIPCIMRYHAARGRLHAYPFDVREFLVLFDAGDEAHPGLLEALESAIAPEDASWRCALGLWAENDASTLVTTRGDGVLWTVRQRNLRFRIERTESGGV